MPRSVVSLARLMWHLRWPPSRLQAWQEENLRKVIDWAYDRVPLYRAKFQRAGILPARVRCLEDLAFLPVTERAEVRDAGEGIRARGMSITDGLQVTTSGSTGMPVTMLFAPREVAIRNALSKRVMLLYREHPWMRRLIVGNPRRLVPTLYQRLGIYREARLSAFAPRGEQVRAYRAYRPHILAGYPSSLRMLGEGLLADEGAVESPRLVVTGGEVLLPSTRAFLARAFRAPVRDCYGIEEMGHVAWECPEGGGYHLAVDCGVFEVLQGEQPVMPGEEGDLVLTSLFGFAMPLIRYRVGDRVALEPDPCPCGCAFPRIRRIVGRADDLLQLPSGEWVHPVVAACGVVDLPGVNRFRIVQEAPARYRVELVSAEPLSREIESTVVSHFRNHLGAIHVAVWRVPDIPADPSGKLRHIFFETRQAPSIRASTEAGEA